MINPTLVPSKYQSNLVHNYSQICASRKTEPNASRKRKTFGASGEIHAHKHKSIWCWEGCGFLQNTQLRNWFNESNINVTMQVCNNCPNRFNGNAFQYFKNQFQTKQQSDLKKIDSIGLLPCAPSIVGPTRIRVYWSLVHPSRSVSSGVYS